MNFDLDTSRSTVLQARHGHILLITSQGGWPVAISRTGEPLL